MKDIKSFPIEDPVYSVAKLGDKYVEMLQVLCERCADYTWIVEGENVAPNAARELLQAAPPGRSLDDKFIYGIFDHREDLVGVLEGMRHYPEPNVWWIGLLILAPETRGSGLGRRIVQSFCDHVRSQAGTAVMLGVVEENQAAHHFWEQMGFDPVRQTEPRVFGKKVQAIHVMRKEIKKS